MSDKLEAYLEEISHFLSGRAEREEILSEIRSHIVEKAAEGPGEFTDAAIERAIAAFGPARKVAERYVDDRPIIAPAYKRYLVRYTSLLFALHAFLTVVAVVFKKDFVIFPLLYMPRLGVIDALMYLPAAFLADLASWRSSSISSLRAARMSSFPGRNSAWTSTRSNRRRRDSGQAASRRRSGPCHAGHYRLRALPLRPARHRLLRQPGLARSAPPLHARRRTLHLDHRHRRFRRLDHGSPGETAHALALGRRRLERHLARPDRPASPPAHRRLVRRPHPRVEPWPASSTASSSPCSSSP